MPVQILGDEERRRVYDETGNLDQQSADIVNLLKNFVSTLFGAGAFESIFGDVCTMPMFRQLLTMIAKGPDAMQEKQDSKEAAAQCAAFDEEEAEYCKTLGNKLLRRIDARARGEIPAKDFAESCKIWAKELLEAPGGADLIKVTG